MYFAAHQFSGGSIDHPVPFQRGDAGEARRRDDDVEMATFARTGMASVLRAVIPDLQQGRVQGVFEYRPQTLDTRIHGASFANMPRNSHSTTPNENTVASGTAIHTLKVTQSLSLRFSATQMLTVPSAR